MKPIYIKMKAFGSYKEEYIDFTEVDHGIFLITGDTGAGKTTIFDAITYALYGESSGGRRDSRMMVSQFAGPNEFTEVEFCFFYGTEKYVVKRSPEQIKFKLKKGEDGGEIYQKLSTNKKPEVTLILPDKTVYIGKLNEINQKIIEIIGMDAAQFTQVAMLSQGDFLKLLHARSDERKEIFSRIFDTNFYLMIQKEIENRYKKICGDLEDNRKEICSWLDNVEPAAGSMYQEKWQEIGEFYEDRKEELLTLISDIVEESRRVCHQEQEGIDECDKKKDKLQKAIGDAELSNKDFTVLKEAMEQQKLLDEKSDEIMLIKEKIAVGEKALKLRGQVMLYEDKCRMLKQSRDSIDGIREKLHKCKENLKPLAERKEEAGERYDKEYRPVIEEIAELDRKLILYKETAELKNLCDNMANQYSELKEERERIARQKEVQGNLLERLQKEIDELINLAGQDDALAGRIERIKSEKKDHEELRWLEDQYKELSDAILNQQKDYNKSKDEYERCRDSYQKLYDEFINGQVHLLRETLVEGEPCRVCGSIHHNIMPQKNVKIVRQEEVERAKEELDRLNEITAEQKDELQRCKITAEETDKQIKQYLEKMDLERQLISVNKLNEELINLENKKKTAEKAKDDLPEKKKILAEGQQTLRELQEREKGIAVEISALKASLEEKQAGLKEKQDSLPYGEQKEAEEYIAQLKIKQEQIVHGKNAADEAYQKAAEELSRLTAMLETEENKCRQTEIEAASLEEEMKKGFEKYGFASKEVYEKACITDEELEGIKEEIVSYDKDVQTVKTNIMLLRERTKDKEPVDTKVLKEELEQVQESLNERRAVLQKHYVNLNKNETARTNVEEKYRMRESLREQYGIISMLHDTANGKISGKRMDFQTYIQRYYFKQVIAAANVRLVEMSNHQFQLVCRDLEQLRAQGNVGLDLDIYSIVNDQIRDVKTLSGGESFIAALSMALGLSDIIQNRAGRIRIDTMFIDEGFGSLDDETRNQALGLLNELSGDNRLIGIISHVSELKSQIEKKLIVTKTDRGSRARWE